MPESSQSGPISWDERPAKKRKANITLACRTCREKRTKCDGQVTCKVCQLYDRECIYDRDKDRRRGVTRDYVAALEDRIRQLEGGNAGSTSPVVSPQTHVLTGQMRTSGDGSTIHYGPTSSYIHLEEQVIVSQPTNNFADNHASLGSFYWGIEWAKNLPSHPCLTLELHQALLSVFFSYANGWCHWLDERSFLNGLATSATVDQPLRTNDYSPFLHNVILAFGCVSMSRHDPWFASSEMLGPLFAQTATSMIDGELAMPLTSTSRGMMLLGSYHFFNSKRNLGWMTAGMGTRVGQILGLNINPGTLLENGTLSRAAHEHRVRVFWTGFIQDVFMNLNVGRRPALSYADFNIDLPTISQAEDAELWYDHQSRLQVGMTGEPGWSSTTFHWSAKLALIASDVYHSIYSVRGLDVDQTIQARTRLELDIAAWLASCPVVLQPDYWHGRPTPPHIISVLAAAHHVRILLHRPTCYAYHTSDAAYRTKAVDLCVSAARQIVRLVHLATARQYTCYILSNAIFAAGTTFLLVSTRNESTKQAVEKASAEADECVRLMLDFPTSASRVGSEILQKLCAEWKTPEKPLEIRASNKDEAVRLLNDANSDMVKLLTELGWQRPSTDTAPVQGDGENDAAMLSSFTGNQSFFNPVNSNSNIENYDPLGWPAWFLNDVADTGNWTG